MCTPFIGFMWRRWELEVVLRRLRCARDPLRLRSGQALCALEKARAFGMTPGRKDDELTKFQQHGGDVIMLGGVSNESVHRENHLLQRF